MCVECSGAGYWEEMVWLGCGWSERPREGGGLGRAGPGCCQRNAAVQGVEQKTMYRYTIHTHIATHI